MEFLLETTKKGFELTGDREKILSLAGLGPRVGKELVIDGDWFSADDVEVHISSVLVRSNKAASLARKLTREEPMRVWLPCFHESENASEYSSHDKEGYMPWVVRPRGEARLDEHDPYGAHSANLRPRLARDFITFCSLFKSDPFGCVWKDKNAHVALRAQVWGRENKYNEDGPHSGIRLFCATSILQKILAKYDNDLIILIKLQRYEKETYREKSKFTHTVAVVHVTKTFDVNYFRGYIDHVTPCP